MRRTQKEKEYFRQKAREYYARSKQLSKEYQVESEPKETFSFFRRRKKQEAKS